MHRVISVIQYCLFSAVLQGDTYNLQYGYDRKYVLTSRNPLFKVRCVNLSALLLGFSEVYRF